MEDRVRLVFRGISQIVGNDHLAIIIVTDEAATRQLSVVCDRHLEYEFGIRQAKAPVVSRLLPEAMWTLLSSMRDVVFSLDVEGINDGQYHVMLRMRIGDTVINDAPIRMSDAVLLSFITGIPMFMNRDFFEHQTQEYEEGMTRLSLPVNVLSRGMLQQALQKAIEDEKYELASFLRDELNKRPAPEEGSRDDIGDTDNDGDIDDMDDMDDMDEEDDE